MGSPRSSTFKMADVASLNYLDLRQWCIDNGCNEEEAAACSDKENLFVLADKNGLTPQTAPSVLKKLEATFAKVDTNGSGEIDDEELCQILATFFKAAAVNGKEAGQETH